LLEINGEWDDKQGTAGVIDPNSGGNTIFISPGLRLTVENWSSYLTVGIPVVSDYNGIQPTPTWRVLAEVSAVFGP
jgi:hypothetical protein